MMKMQKSCSNCNVPGHLKVACLKPRISCGVIPWRYSHVSKQIEYLMIQRRDSIAFVDICRGNFQLNNKKYIIKLLRNCRLDELQKLHGNIIDVGSIGSWVTSISNKLRMLYDMPWFAYEVNRIMVMKKMGRLPLSLGWGFPKGKRNFNESDLKCARREFEEETGYRFIRGRWDWTNANSGKLMKIKEMFTGTNGLRYEYRFYVAECTDLFLPDPIVNPDVPNQFYEVRDVKWISHDDVLQYLERPSAKKYFMNVHQHILHMRMCGVGGYDVVQMRHSI